MKNVAILLDGAFVQKRLQRLLKAPATEADIIAFSQKCLAKDEELFRIYYYDCPPYDRAEYNPLSKTMVDFSATSAYQRNTIIQERLATSDHVAYRRGVLAFRGWVITKQATKEVLSTGRAVSAADLVPELDQKRVDMKIGLDVAWLSTKRIVERLILVTGDTDFVPAMKFARQEGVQVIIATPGSMKLQTDLVKHSDEVRIVTYP